MIDMVVGIIAEYNLLHNGHALQLDFAKNTLRADSIVLALSPDFTQRGEIAILSKYERARIALELGVDLVVQIPVNSATDSSLGYAYGSIKTLDGLGIVDTLLFSAEDDDIDILSDIANIEIDESLSYTNTLNESLRVGLSYPKARENAILEAIKDSDEDIPTNLITDIISKPNNILAIEYLKALKLLNSDITPVCMKRIGSSYNDDVIEGSIASASAIRLAIKNGNPASIEATVPPKAYEYYKKYYDNNEFLFPDDTSLMLGYKLLEGNLNEYKDCNEELSNKITNELSNYTNMTSFRALIKSKNITEARISRVLCHILLNITDDLYIKSQGRIYPHIPYIYILGINDNGANLLSEINSNHTLPFFTSYIEARKFYDDSSKDSIKARQVLEADINSTNIYNLILANKTSSNVTPELSRRFLRV